MSIDTIGDCLTIIRNGLHRKKHSVLLSHSKIRESLIEILKKEGYIKDFSIEKIDENKSNIKIVLKYAKGEGVIQELTRVSKPSRRRYEKSRKITPVIGGLGVSILTTSKGLLTDREAKKLSVGGEVLCHIW